MNKGEVAKLARASHVWLDEQIKNATKQTKSFKDGTHLNTRWMTRLDDLLEAKVTKLKAA